MKADAGNALGFVPASKANTSASSKTRDADGGNDQFARLMRQSEARSDAQTRATARSNDARANESRNTEARASQARSGEARHDAAEKKPADNGAKEASDRPATQTRRKPENTAGADSRKPQDTRPADARDLAEAASTSSDTSTIAHDGQLAETVSDDDDTAFPLDWPPAGLILPSLLGDTAATLNPATSGFATGDVLLGGANRLPGALRLALAGGTLPQAGVEGAPLPAGFAGNTSTDTTADALAANGQARADASNPLPASAGNASAATATTPVTGDAPASIALPAGMVMFKDTLEALATGKREDATTLAAALTAPASSAPVSDNGLARTATVNPLTSMTPTLHTDQFGETLGTQLTFMADQKISHAHIKVSPHELGTIEINLRLDGDRVHADFSSAQPDVRQALEQSLPKLRDMLGQQGFQLAQADVGHRQQSQSSPSQGSSGRSSGDGMSGGNASEPTPPPVIRIARGLLDAYA